MVLSEPKVVEPFAMSASPDGEARSYTPQRPRPLHSNFAIVSVSTEPYRASNLRKIASVSMSSMRVRDLVVAKAEMYGRR